MASPAPTSPTVPAKRRGPSTASIRERVTEEYNKRLSTARAKVASVAKSQTAAEGAGVVGAAAAGMAERQGLGLTLMDRSIPAGIPAGAVAYIAGRKMGNPLLRGAGYGAFLGGVTLLVSDW